MAIFPTAILVIIFIAFYFKKKPNNLELKIFLKRMGMIVFLTSVSAVLITLLAFWFYKEGASSKVRLITLIGSSIIFITSTLSIVLGVGYLIFGLLTSKKEKFKFYEKIMALSFILFPLTFFVAVFIMIGNFLG